MDVVGADDGTTSAFNRKLNVHTQGGGTTIYGPMNVDGPMSASGQIRGRSFASTVEARKYLSLSTTPAFT